jgi:macrophage erythroblast attacher
VDIKLFAELVRIENALVDKQSVAEALAWCGENRGTLKKTKVSQVKTIGIGLDQQRDTADYATQNNLEFTLRLQEFIELCRKRDTVGAISYARKTLAPWASTHMHEIEQGMTLLAFGERTGVGAYRVSWRDYLRVPRLGITVCSPASTRAIPLRLQLRHQ